MALEIGQNHYEDYEGYKFEIKIRHSKGVYYLNVCPVVGKDGTDRTTSPLDAENAIVGKAARRSRAKDAEAIAAAETQKADLIQKVAAKKLGEQFSQRGAHG